LTARRVVVTGASSGIGRAIAIACARRGDRVIASARNENALADLAREERNVEPCAGDVTREEDRIRLIETAERDGPIDVLVNNAGRGYYAAFRDIRAHELEDLFALNVIAPLRLTQLALASLEKTRGAVVMMSSVAGIVSSPRLGAYSASKFALEALAIALRAEIAASHVAVIVVRPGPVDTPFRENSITQSTTPGVRPPGSRAQTAEHIARATLAAIDRRRAVVETSAFVRVASFGARVVPPIFRAAIKRM
jgi:short-subunit dehydrogenase